MHSFFAAVHYLTAKTGNNIAKPAIETAGTCFNFAWYA
jgi:hypothetical protein